MILNLCRQQNPKDKDQLKEFEVNNNEMNQLIRIREKEIQDINYDLRTVQNENTSLIQELQSAIKENEKM